MGGLTDPTGVSFEQYGGPNAPHVFKFIRRSDLNWELNQSQSEGCGIPHTHHVADDIPHHDWDVFMLTRHYMSSSRVLQVTAVCSWHRQGQHLREQPEGSRPKKPIPRHLPKFIHVQCTMALRQTLISDCAAGFLR